MRGYQGNYQLYNKSMRIQRNRTRAHVGLNVNLPICIYLQQAAAIEKAVRNREIADSGVGISVAGVMGRERDIGSGGRAGEVGFVEHPKRSIRNAAPADACKSKGLLRSGADVDRVDLLEARDEGDASRRRRGQAARSVGKCAMITASWELCSSKNRTAHSAPTSPDVPSTVLETGTPLRKSEVASNNRTEAVYEAGKKP
jgi:hypothetical protein